MVSEVMTAKSPYRTAAELVERVDTLFTLPEVYLRVKTVVEDPDSCLSDLVNAIALDPGITARLLKLVNSAYFNLGSHIENLRQAVNLLGMKSVHDLVLATVLTSALTDQHGSSAYLRNFWVQSIRRAVYAHLLAKACGMIDHERLFIGGLLCDVGHQVMYWQIPELAREAERMAARSDTPLHVAERELIGFSYADAGGELLHRWRMPEYLVEIVHRHVEPWRAERFPRDSSIAHIACALNELDEGRLAEADLLDRIVGDAWEWTGLNRAEIALIRREAQAECEETTGLLLAVA